MTFLKSTLYACVLATLGLLGAEKSVAQSYTVLNVTTEGPAINADCRHINNNGTVACRERTYIYSFTPTGFEDRVTFDNPFYIGVGRDLPTISGFPINTDVGIVGISIGSIVTGTLTSHYEGSRFTQKAFAVSSSGSMNMDPSAIYPTPSAAVDFSAALSVNDQGWMILSGSSSVGPGFYLRVPSSSDLNSGISYTITCPGRQTPIWVKKVNRNGLIVGDCPSSTGFTTGTTAVVWGWWDLNNPVDLIAFLPVNVDLGSGLVPRSPSTFDSCRVTDMADSGDVILIRCFHTHGETSFVISASGSRQLDATIYSWGAVNQQGCAIGYTFDAGAASAVVDCGAGVRRLSTLTGMHIDFARDINDRGDILASTGSGYVVLVPR